MLLGPIFKALCAAADNQVVAGNKSALKCCGGSANKKYGQYCVIIGVAVLLTNASQSILFV